MRATLAERLGLISAAQGERLEAETPAERALRRAGLHVDVARDIARIAATDSRPAGEALIEDLERLAASSRPTGNGRKACLKRWQRREQRLPRRGCTSRHPAGHRFMMAADVRSMRAGGERCA
jgi:hypothetical protein